MTLTSSEFSPSGVCKFIVSSYGYDEIKTRVVCSLRNTTRVFIVAVDSQNLQRQAAKRMDARHRYRDVPLSAVADLTGSRKGLFYAQTVAATTVRGSRNTDRNGSHKP